MIVLDTHVWLWWVNLDKTRLKSSWLQKIQYSNRVCVSAISCFEVAWLDRHQRIILPCPRGAWFDKALTGSGIELLPITTEIASIAVDLPEHHSDPQDRIIIATALLNAADLLSADAKFPRYQELAGKLVD
jgi:PIN domain nuclease of toxin-antitoxin system